MELVVAPGPLHVAPTKAAGSVLCVDPARLSLTHSPLYAPFPSSKVATRGDLKNAHAPHTLTLLLENPGGRDHGTTRGSSILETFPLICTIELIIERDRE